MLLFIVTMGFVENVVHDLQNLKLIPLREIRQVNTILSTSYMITQNTLCSRKQTMLSRVQCSGIIQK